jgi:hypothetical protein
MAVLFCQVYFLGWVLEGHGCRVPCIIVIKQQLKELGFGVYHWVSGVKGGDGDQGFWQDHAIGCPRLMQRDNRLQGVP